MSSPSKRSSSRARDTDEDLAYGDYHERSGPGEKGLLGDAFKKFGFRNSSSSSSNQPNVTQQYQPQLYTAPSTNTQTPSVAADKPAQSQSTIDSLFAKGQSLLHDISSQVSGKIGEYEAHSHTHLGALCNHESHDQANNRYGSFAAQRAGNNVKWYVDGCGYMWAVSSALEAAQKSIWILDWWLSPELYLRRPPSSNEQYRIDRLLLAAAQRGVRVNIIIYKEVTQALTREYLNPIVPDYLHSLLPTSTHPVISMLSKLGLASLFASLDDLETQNPLIDLITVDSSHTKHTLESLHPNISVFRHPDHIVDLRDLKSSFASSLQNFSLNAATASKLPEDALKALYGANDDIVLYWAHHEKLCLVDGTLAFMGGLDLCFGRWDLNQHPIADAHPLDLNSVVFPGQDYNNARIMDFSHVDKYDQNKLDRTKFSRMGWSDVSICLQGPAVEDLRAHFVQRWNFIYNEKYDVQNDRKYSRLSIADSHLGIIPNQSGGIPANERLFAPRSDAQIQRETVQTKETPSQIYFPPPPSASSTSTTTGNKTTEEDRSQTSTGFGAGGGIRGRLEDKVAQKYRRAREELDKRLDPRTSGQGEIVGDVPCQLVRSCSKWSNGTPTEHSIANAYMDTIERSERFIYIENQFFITATSDEQKPVRNKIASAVVARILRAAKAQQKFKVIVVMPSVPGFAGDLKDESSLGTRAIMEFQYNSINRGGNSIYEAIAKEGFDPTEYIRFYNLRNYDRINVSSDMKEAEKSSGVSYEDARQSHDDALEAHPTTSSEIRGNKSGQTSKAYQAGAAAISDLPSVRWDTVSECYMLDGTDIRNVPWSSGNVAEIDAFVSEELYIHSKILIADDRTVICGSANMNDRSQLGDHDSEIALVIEDQNFATTLRRQIFRKHLGLIPPQVMNQPNQNFEPLGVPNVYDFGSAEDQLVVDPLAENFQNYWNSTARINTDAFRQVFHCVPDDNVKTWRDYDDFFGKHFHAQEKDGKKVPAQYEWGHVVKELFPTGQEGLDEVKTILSKVRGNLVEMPLLFLIQEDIAKQGVSLNAFTEEIYT